MILGCYFLTVENPKYEDVELKAFSVLWMKLGSLGSPMRSISIVELLLTSNERVTDYGRVVFNRTVQDVLREHDITDEPFINPF